MGTGDPLPPASVLVGAADAGLHPWVRAHVAADVRRAALRQELSFWLDTAARDLDYAWAYAEGAPAIGQPVEAYLDRWLAIGTGAHVLAGPRYLGRDPDLPFVGVSGSDRPLLPGDRGALVALAREHFAPFGPGFVMVTTADPPGAWPGTGTEMRQVVGLLGRLRARSLPAELATRPRRDTGFYDRYLALHAAQVAREPAHARHARTEDRETLADLAERGLLFDVLVDGAWAGIVAAEPDARRGLRGVTVIELLLDEEYRGRGYGRHLSVALARAVPQPDAEFLLGTIHLDNIPAYRAALAAGRIDVGGEVRIPL